jgi:undecaprenyl-diphosphatase
MEIIQAILLAIVEGITEFLPISSTGHMIIVSSMMGIQANDFTKLFEVSIQLGAILAVIVFYRKKFMEFKNIYFYIKLAIGVLPALMFGFIFSDAIDALLESPLTVAISLLAGGIIFLFIDRLFIQHTITTETSITYKTSFIIGIWQTMAMIPGVSRSAASIIGGLQQKLTRNLAAEFSFFLAVPTMAAATLYSLFIKNWSTNVKEQKGFELILQSTQNITAFLVGNAVAFVIALLSIKFLIGYLQRHGFKWFGWYRIFVGLILIVLLKLGYF